MQHGNVANVLSGCNQLNLTIGRIGLFLGLKVFTTHYYVIKTFMVDRLAGQNTLTLC